jgi:ADP-ribose pyrophosphatase YjhB (NUDIX family)
VSGPEPEWLARARELQAIAQIGLTYATDKFDIERYERIREIAATMMAEGSGEPVAPILDLFRQDVGYATPKVDVRGAAFRDGKILLVREINDGKWSMPGGWADVNRSATECVEKEVLEESGFACRAVKLAAVWDRSRQGHITLHPRSVYKMFFLCEITGGAARASTETDGAAFFAEDALPDLSLTRITERQIRRMFEHWREPDLPTEFD